MRPADAGPKRRESKQGRIGRLPHSSSSNTSPKLPTSKPGHCTERHPLNADERTLCRAATAADSSLGLEQVQDVRGDPDRNDRGTEDGEVAPELGLGHLRVRLALNKLHFRRAGMRPATSKELVFVLRVGDGVGCWDSLGFSRQGASFGGPPPATSLARETWAPDHRTGSRPIPQLPPPFEKQLFPQASVTPLTLLALHAISIFWWNACTVQSQNPAGFAKDNPALAGASFHGDARPGAGIGAAGTP